MAVYEHLRKYRVIEAGSQEVTLAGPFKRSYWLKSLSQGFAKQEFKRALKVGDVVVYKRVSNRVTTYYTPIKLK